ncbi:MAG: hypothetical protein MUP40_02190, partial [Actinobacteria bacterium]|nr:hypothetical protein [Actinomycetota bacterium]
PPFKPGLYTPYPQVDSIKDCRHQQQYLVLQAIFMHKMKCCQDESNINILYPVGQDFLRGMKVYLRFNPVSRVHSGPIFRPRFLIRGSLLNVKAAHAALLQIKSLGQTT